MQWELRLAQGQMKKARGLLERYRQFVQENTEIIGNAESTLRSLCYIIPGRFNDSDLIAEIRTMSPHQRSLISFIVFALLNLFRLYNDTILSDSKSSGPLRPSIWNKYLEFLKGQSPLARILVSWLNVLRILEVPAEMIIGKFIGACARNRFIILVELQKLLAKTVLWVLSGFKKSTGTLMPSSTRMSKAALSHSDSLTASQADLLASSLEMDHPEALHEFIKSSRQTSLNLMPELIMSSTVTPMGKLRELAHIIRPFLYATLFVYGRSPRVKWSGWIAALCLELFSSWSTLLPSQAEKSFVEKDEDASRLTRLLFFLLREPFYSAASKDRLDALKQVLGEWKLLRPIINTADTYQKLCERVYFYTSLARGSTPASRRMDIDAGPILVRLQSQAPASVQPAFAQFSTLYDRKLWHELTLALDRLFRDPQGQSMIVPLYRELVLPLQKRLSPDSFVHFSVMAAEQLKGEEAIGLLLDIANQFKGDAKHVHLFVWARMSAALYQLAAGSLMETKEAIDQCQPLVDAFSGVDPLVKAAYFKVRSQYDKVKADFSAFYRDTFLFLACVKMEDLSVDEKTGLAHDLSVAALLVDTVYNFGELLMHPVLEAIQPDLSYLVATLSAFNCGDHGRFEQLLPTITKGSPILAGRLGFLRQKMCLMSLIEAVFAGLKESRRLGFAVIADRTHVPLGEVEFLLIKAMSLGLIKGRIDELAQVLVVDWVQPRVLDRKQMLELRSTIQSWKARIAGLSGDFDLWNTLPIAAAAMDE